MNDTQFSKLRLGLTFVVFMLTSAFLAWEYNNGGVVSHYLLHRKDMPSISNWWALLLMPVLAWLCVSSAKARIVDSSILSSDQSVDRKKVYASFFFMLSISIVQSVSFQLGFGQVTMYLAVAILLLGLVVPIYRGEFVLGHVLGAAFTFGAVIPLIGITIMGSVSAIAHLLIKPLILRVFGSK